VAAASGGFVVSAEAKSSCAWKDKDTLLVGTVVGGDTGRDLTASGYPRTVREWTRGQPLAEAPVVFEGLRGDVSVSGSVARHRGWAFERRHRSTSFFTYDQALRCVGTPPGVEGAGACGGGGGDDGGAFESLRLVVPADASVGHFGHFAGQAVVSLKTTPWAGHPPGTLLAVDARALLAAAATATAKAKAGTAAAAASEGSGEAAFGALAATVLFSPTATSCRQGLISCSRRHRSDTSKWDAWWIVGRRHGEL